MSWKLEGLEQPRTTAVGLGAALSGGVRVGWRRAAAWLRLVGATGILRRTSPIARLLLLRAAVIAPRSCVTA